MDKYCFLNGEIMPLTEAKVGIEDIGLLRGYGVYDGLSVIGGKVFRFEDHWNRFLSSAHALSLNIPITPEKAKEVIEELAVKNGFMDRANARLILTGGKTLGGIEYDFNEPTFYILVEKWEPLPEDYYKNGAKLITYRYSREWPTHKTTNYIQAVSLQDLRKEKKAVEILYVYDGEILECATSNIFLVKDDKLITPSDGVLGGITRKVVLELVGVSGKYEIEERPVYEDELKTIDEVFITSSFKDIVPIVNIDDSEVGSGQVGPIAKDLMQAFAKVINIG